MHPILVSYVIVVLGTMAIATAQVVFDMSKSELGTWVQAIGSVAAVLAAIGLYAAQRRRDREEAHGKVDSCRQVLRLLAEKALAMTKEAEDPAFYIPKIGTWDQYKSMRVREFTEFHSFVCTLPTEQLVDGQLLRVAAEMRIQLRQMQDVLDESQFEHPLWRSSVSMIGRCRREFERICTELGTDPSQIQPEIVSLFLDQDSSENPAITSN